MGFVYLPIVCVKENSIIGLSESFFSVRTRSGRLNENKGSLFDVKRNVSQGRTAMKGNTMDYINNISRVF